MAVVVPKNRVAMLFRSRDKALKELAREARLLTKGSNFAIWIGPRSESDFAADVVVYRKHAEDRLPCGEPAARGYINLIQHRSVLMEMVMELLEKAEEKT